MDIGTLVWVTSPFASAELYTQRSSGWFSKTSRGEGDTAGKPENWFVRRIGENQMRERCAGDYITARKQNGDCN